MTWETVIGLEVHVQLGTKSKMFCGCAATFGEEPNTNVCPVCLGLPGALPVPNGEAIRLGVRGALALECAVHPVSIFSRKNYFYPDLPKGYQISQFDRPLATGGWLNIESPERGAIVVGITRLHLEEDAGKSLHDRFPGLTAVDLNRAGVPLAEIVSEPDLRSPGEARAYLTALKQILVYAGVSDCSMEKGHLRVDGNISVRQAGESKLGTKTEVKNVNSFANVERALTAERDRQIAELEAGGTIRQMTLTFNAATGEVRALRSKEESHDYRYFPDPDLPPLVVDPARIEAERAALPELPAAKIARLVGSFGLSAYDAQVLAADVEVARYFEAVVAAGAEPKAAANWIMTEALPGWNAMGLFLVPAPDLAELLGMVREGDLSLQAAKKVFGEMTSTRVTGVGGVVGGATLRGVGQVTDPRAIARLLNLEQVRDTSALEGWVTEVLAAHAGEVARYRAGEVKLLGFLVGQVMKRSQGKADPKGVQPVLLKALSSDN